MDDRTYSPENYTANDMDYYRKWFLEETITLTDQQLYELVMSTEDDLDVDGWRKLFNEYVNKVSA